MARGGHFTWRLTEPDAATCRAAFLRDHDPAAAAALRAKEDLRRSRKSKDARQPDLDLDDEERRTTAITQTRTHSGVGYDENAPKPIRRTCAS